VIARRLFEVIAEIVNAQYIECVTAMGRFSHFLQASGFREIPNPASAWEAELSDWSRRHQVPPHVCLEGTAFAQWTDAQSVRVAREGRRLVWRLYHHLVLHRRTRRAPPRKVVGPTDTRWPEAWDLAARRLLDRPSHWILGPLDPMTGMSETPQPPPSEYRADAVEIARPGHILGTPSD
jgi:hypothetical protein